MQILCNTSYSIYSAFPIKISLIYLFADTPIYFFGFKWKLMVVTIEFILLLLTQRLNTAIELVVDYVAKNKKFYLAKKSKDIASIAVSIAPFNIGMVSYYSIETLKLLFSHQVNDVPEIPLVVDSLQISKTKELLKILYALGCEDELATILETKKIRPRWSFR